MSEIINERMTATMDGEFVVFMLGMRINRWWRVDRWWPLARMMPRMLRELSEKPELGLLGYESWFGRTTIMVQYWRSHECLKNYARARDSQHLPAWREFNRRVGKSGDVGIWHESYTIAPDRHESIYHHMPQFGLGRASGLMAARRRRPAAHKRPDRGMVGHGSHAAT